MRPRTARSEVAVSPERAARSSIRRSRKEVAGNRARRGRVTLQNDLRRADAADADEARFAAGDFLTGCPWSLLLFIFACTAILPLTSCGEKLPQGTTAIVFSYGLVSPQHEQALSELVASFEKANPEIKVILHTLPPITDLQRNFYLQLFRAESRFVDVFEMDTIWASELAAPGLLLNLDERLGNERKEHFEPVALDSATYDGHLYGIPAFPAVSLLYYRIDLLDKHGMPVPVTYSQLAQTARTIAAAEGIDGFLWQGADYEGLVCNFLEIYRAFGGRVENLAEGVRIDPEAAKEALEYLKGLVGSGASPKDVLDHRETDTRQAFIAGDAVFARHWDDLTAFLEAPDSTVAGKVGLAPLPGEMNPTAGGTPTYGGWHLAVNARALHPDAAYKLVQFLTQPDSQAFLAQRLGRLPSDRAVPLPSRPGVEGMDSIRKSLSQAQPRPKSPYYHDLSVILQEEIHKGLTGSVDVDTAAANCVERAREVRLPRHASPDFPDRLMVPATIY